MGNTWFYELIFEETKLFTSELFGQVLSVAKEQAYKLRYPTYVADPDEVDALEFYDVETLSTYICSQGGHFTVWREEEGILLGFYPSERYIGLGIQYNLRKDRDEQISLDLENLFLAFCQNFQPSCGYCDDEWSLEIIFPRELAENWGKFQSNILKQEPPMLLFWINYFSTTYFSKIGEWRFEELQLSKLVTTREHGVFMYLAASPWDIEHAILGEDGKYHLIEIT
ncbi:MAG: hypothetical protein H0X30_07130 [Anaerolineae bacterium]|nr:hypothetical protein [Anaerolineae bacterium]